MVRSTSLWAGPPALPCTASFLVPVTTSWSREMPTYSACWKWRARSDCRRLRPAAIGEARISLRVGGGWAGFAAAAVTGTAQLHAVRARVRGLNEPVEISSASLELLPASTEVRKLTASVAGNTWRGSLTVPRQCEKPQACPIRVDLHTDEFVDRCTGRPGECVARKTALVSLSVVAGATEALSGFLTRGRKAHGQSRCDSQPGREPGLGRGRTRAGPPSTFEPAWRRPGWTPRRRMASGLHGQSSRPITAPARWRKLRWRKSRKPCMTPGSRERPMSNIRADTVGLDQGGIAFPRRRRFPGGSSRWFAASPHAGRRKRPASSQPLRGTIASAGREVRD